MSYLLIYIFLTCTYVEFGKEEETPEEAFDVLQKVTTGDGRAAQVIDECVVRIQAAETIFARHLCLDDTLVDAETREERHPDNEIDVRVKPVFY